MKRRTFVTGLGAVLAARLGAEAQQAAKNGTAKDVKAFMSTFSPDYRGTGMNGQTQDFKGAGGKDDFPRRHAPPSRPAERTRTVRDERQPVLPARLHELAENYRRSLKHRTN